MPKVSIITTSHNSEKYIKQCCLSVLSQTFKDFEWIIVDNCSSDNTVNILGDYIKNRTNVNLVLNKKPANIPLSLNRAILESNGEYIAVLDADDICLRYRLHRQVDKLDSCQDLSIVGSKVILIDENDLEIGYWDVPLTEKDGLSWMINRQKNPLMHSSSMLRKDVLIRHNGYNTGLNFAGDLELIGRLLQHGYKMYNFQESLVKYRRYKNQASQVHYIAMMAESSAILLDVVENAMLDPPSMFHSF